MNTAEIWSLENWPESLFAPSLLDRWNNTRQWLKEQGKKGGPINEVVDDIARDAETSWPPWVGCEPAGSGAINAWLVTIGPSEGRSDPEDKKTRWVDNLYFGIKHKDFVPSSDTKGFFDTLVGQEGALPVFFKEFGLDTEEGLALTLMANILSKKEHSGRQPHPDLLLPGVRRALSMIRQTRARCVLALTNDVFDCLRDALGFPDNKDTLVGRYKVTNNVLRPRWTTGYTNDGLRVILAKTPNHPSKSPFWKQHISQFGIDLARVVRGQLGL